MFKSPFRNEPSCRFVIDPLDIGIADMQLELIKSLEKCLRTGNFEPVTVSFESRNPMRRIGWVKIDCSLIDEAEENYRLTLTIWEKESPNKKRHTLCEGALAYINEYVNSAFAFRQDCKGWAMIFDIMLRESKNG